MPVSYSAADQDVLDLLNDVMRECHRPLFDAAVRVGVLMAVNDTGDAVTGGGYPAYAKIKVISLKDRVLKCVDAEVVIDLHEWDRFTPAVREALLDHELSHIVLKAFSYEPVLDADGEPTGEVEILFEKDDQGRPKLKARRGDFNAGDAFERVIARRGRDALEFLNAKRFDEFAEAAIRAAR